MFTKDILDENSFKNAKLLNEELNSILSSISCGILQYRRADNKLLRANRAALDILGYDTFEELAGDRDNGIVMTVFAEDRAHIKEIADSLTEPGEVKSFEYRVKHKDAEDITYCYGTVQLYADANGELNILRTIMDITDRKLREKSAEDLEHLLYVQQQMNYQQRDMLATIRKERQQYRDALVSGSEYSYRFDVTEGIVDSDFDYSARGGIRENLGISLPISFNDLVSHWTKIMQPEYLTPDIQNPLTVDDIKRCYKNGMKHIVSEYYNRKEKRYFRRTMLLSMDDETDHLWAIAIINDITSSIREESRARKALEEAYEAANHASVAKTKFLSSVSHDIRTPLNGIIGMTAIAETHLDDKNRIYDCLNKISISSKHLLSLINEVLDMNKIESGKLDLNTGEFNLDELIETLIVMIKPQVESKHHEFNVNVHDIVHKNVIGDILRIRQVFINLLSNAIKYTPEGGIIKFSMTEKQTNNPKVGCYEFTVEDNGIGMTKEFQEHLFEPFSREKDSRINEIQGSGLGMPIAKNIIKMMNGDIQVESELSKGTRFIVTLYLELKSTLEAEESATIKSDNSAIENLSEADFSSKRALVTEDNDLNAEIAGEILGMTGIEIEYAVNGKEAVDLITEKPESYYDIIFMDVQMPLMNGYDATRAIRAIGSEYTKNIPIIAMTANAFADDVRAAKNAGMNEHIAKPLNLAQLVSSLNRWLG